MKALKQRDWPFYKMNVKKAWNLVNIENLNRVKIAFLDSGCNIKHPYLEGLNIVCMNSVGEITDDDNLGHGTFFAGILGQYINVNGKASPQIISIKLGHNGQIAVEDICRGIKIAIDNNVDVLNIGACNLNYNPEIAKEIFNAVKKNIILISPIGNNLIDEYTYPATLDTVCSCASTNENYEIAAHSNFNKLLDVCAPGENLTGSIDQYDKLNLKVNSDGTTTTSGTSFAAAIVTTAAALIKSKDKSVNQKFFQQILENSLRKDCMIKSIDGELISKKIIDFYDILHWMDKNKIYQKNIKVERNFYWNIVNPNNLDMRGKWSAQVYDSCGNTVCDIEGKVKIELYDFSKKKNLSPKLVIQKNLENGEINWSFQYNVAGRYCLRIISEIKKVINGLAFGNIYPTPPQLKFVERDKEDIRISFNTDIELSTIYYSFDNDKISIDSKREPKAGTYIYKGEFKAPLHVKKINAASYSNELFCKIVEFNINEY